MEQQELVDDAWALAKAIAASAVDEGLPLPERGRTAHLLRSIDRRFEFLVRGSVVDPEAAERLLGESERTRLVVESLAELCSTIVRQLGEKGVVIRNLPEILASPYLLPMPE